MSRINVYDLPIAANVCKQVLREVKKQPEWSMAHVLMNPMAESLPHYHAKITEIYVITKGLGELRIGSPNNDFYTQVSAGSIYCIPPNEMHFLRNVSCGHLEHLVFAFPAFDPEDVNVAEREISNNSILRTSPVPLQLPEIQEGFDCSKIIPYEFPMHNFSIVFGWVASESERIKKTHYHRKFTEYIFIAEGKGFIKIERTKKPLKKGDLYRIDPGVSHALINEFPEDMVAVCFCYPQFQMEDVYF